MPLTILQDYEDLERIGEGSFGRVFKVRCRADNQIYARKEINWGALEPHMRKLLRDEVRLLLMIKHPNVVGYTQAVDDVNNQTLHIFMEYCAFGDLKKYISNVIKHGRMIPENQLWSILEQLTMALFRCHSGYNHPRDLAGRHGSVLYGDGFRFYHRDLKPENIFIDSTGSIKLGDFGLCGLLEPGERMRSTFVGTQPYMSPELLNGQPYTEKSETWGLGCILHEMATGNVTSFTESMGWGETHARVSIPGFYSEEICKVIKACLTINPEKRPGVQDLADHLCVVNARGERQLRREHKKWDDMKRIMDKEQEEKFSLKFHALNIQYQAAVAELQRCQELVNTQGESLHAQKAHLECLDAARKQREGIKDGTKATVEGLAKAWGIRNLRLKVKARGLARRQKELERREAALSLAEAALSVKKSDGAGYQLQSENESQAQLNAGVDKEIEKRAEVRRADKGGGEKNRSVEVVEDDGEEEDEADDGEEEAEEYDTEEDDGEEVVDSGWEHKRTKSHAGCSYELD